MEWMVNNIQLTWMLRTYKLCNSNGEIFKYEIYQFSKVTHGSKNPYMRVRDAKIKRSVRSGIWPHAFSRRPELESSALDHSAILTFAAVFSLAF